MLTDVGSLTCCAWLWIKIGIGLICFDDPRLALDMFGCIHCYYYQIFVFAWLYPLESLDTWMGLCWLFLKGEGHFIEVLSNFWCMSEDCADGLVLGYAWILGSFICLGFGSSTVKVKGFVKALGWHLCLFYFSLNFNH